MKIELDEEAMRAVKSLVGEMEAIKRLFVFLLLKGGASQAELGKALNIDQASISRLGIGKVNPLAVEVLDREEGKRLKGTRN
jgi:hypothetical protein